jgi:hypothetical protein
MRLLQRTLIGILVMAALSPEMALSQRASDDREGSIFPSHGFLITGYGSTGYRATFLEDDAPNDFQASVNPIMLFQISDRFLFEAELEFELEEGVTATGLEYAQIDYSLTDNLKVMAGKFLLPFNIFSERLHPTWINKFVSTPPLYGHEAGVSASPLLPILSDVGLQVRGTFDLKDFWYVTGVAFISQGPSIEEEHEEEPGMEPEGPFEVPEVVFGRNFEDNNESKMVGGRLGLGLAPYFELNLSAMTADYDPVGQLRFTAYGAHLEARHRGVELHGEWILTRQDVTATEDPTQVETLERDGYFVQAGYRVGNWEPIARWTQILDGEVDSVTVLEGADQLGLGMAYWFTPTLVAKAEYLLHFEDADVENNQLALQWAFGF